MISFVLVHISCCSLSFLVIIVRLCMFSFFFNIILSHEQTYSDIIVTKYMFTASNGNEKKFTSSFSARCSKSYVLWKKKNEITMTINVINKSKIHFSALNTVQTYFIFIFYYKESSMMECIAWGSNNFNFVKHQNVCFLFFDSYISASFHYAWSCQ